MPYAALILGYLGLIPFVGLAAAVIAGPASLGPSAAFALLAYGATILSFLGGVHWGLAIAASALPPSQRAWVLTVSVIPQLLGWSALLAPSPFGFALMAMGLVGVLAIDAGAARAKLAPNWFMALRWPLSCAAAAALIVTALAM
ncbi:MAG: DUF3429 domain-containing protein [Hyphomonadaceae bacterium]|nr:DUF3429 domain-containing protein [Hyphomonadaceae bacterium]